MNVPNRIHPFNLQSRWQKTITKENFSNHYYFCLIKGKSSAIETQKFKQTLARAPRKLSELGEKYKDLILSGLCTAVFKNALNPVNWREKNSNKK